jgi:hypothetical protein
MGTNGTIRNRDRTMLLRLFPAVLGATVYVLQSGEVPSTRLLLGFAAFTLAVLLGVVAVRWLRNDRRAAYLLAIGISVTITAGALLARFLFAASSVLD